MNSYNVIDMDCIGCPAFCESFLVVECDIHSYAPEFDNNVQLLPFHEPVQNQMFLPWTVCDIFDGGSADRAKAAVAFRLFMSSSNDHL